MNRVLRYSFLAILTGLLIAFGFSAEVRAQGPIGQILNTMDGHYKRLSSLQSDLTMVTIDANLGKAGTDTTLGNINYVPKTAKRKMYVRLNWTKPTEEWMVVVGDDYKTYRPKIKQGYIGKTDKASKSNKAGGALAFISMSKEQLKANYDIKYIGQEQISGGTLTWHILLTPYAAQSYQFADMWVDGDGMPRQFKITEKNNDTRTFLLTNIKKNIKIDPNVFKLDPPKGAIMKKV